MFYQFAHLLTETHHLISLNETKYFTTNVNFVLYTLYFSVIVLPHHNFQMVLDLWITTHNKRCFIQKHNVKITQQHVFEKNNIFSYMYWKLCLYKILVNDSSWYKYVYLYLYKYVFMYKMSQNQSEASDIIYNESSKYSWLKQYICKHKLTKYKFIYIIYKEREREKKNAYLQNVFTTNSYSPTRYVFSHSFQLEFYYCTASM